MFSTAMRTAVRSPSSAIDGAKMAAAARCQTNGGCTTTVVRAESLGHVDRAGQFHQRIGRPHPRGHQQARRMHGKHRNLILLHEIGQQVGILAQCLCLHHHLDAVISQVRSHGEGGGRALRIYGGGRHADLDRRNTNDRRMRIRRRPIFSHSPAPWPRADLLWSPLRYRPRKVLPTVAGPCCDAELPGLGLQFVAESPHGDQVARGGRIRLDLRPQPFDVDVERLGVTDIIASPTPGRSIAPW